MCKTWGKIRMRIGIVLMPIRIRIRIGIKMEIRILIGMITMPINNTVFYNPFNFLPFWITFDKIG
jgi:hypothetical protein